MFENWKAWVISLAVVFIIIAGVAIAVEEAGIFK